jgi:hypothetical protein
LSRLCRLVWIVAVKVREKVTADGKKFQKMLEDLNKLEVRIGIQQGVGSEDVVPVGSLLPIPCKVLPN